jgi:hypothetical protein
MFRMLRTLLTTARSAFRCRAEPVLENAALRQQLATYAAKGDKPRIRPADRVFWVVLQRLWTRANDWLVFGKPTTLVLLDYPALVGNSVDWCSRRRSRPVWFGLPFGPSGSSRSAEGTLALEGFVARRLP